MVDILHINISIVVSLQPSKERPTVLFFWLHGTPRSGDSYDLHLNEA